jgi:hypothetical protein
MHTMSPFSILDVIGLQYFHQVIETDRMPLAPEMVVQIDHHAAALRAVLGEELDAERLRLAALEAIPSLGILLRSRDHVLARAEAVVEHELRLAVAVGVEAAADVGERVPLRRVLQRHQHLVVADHVGHVLVVFVERPAEELLAVALRRRDARRIAARIEHRAAGIVERQREAEGLALLHLGDALQHLLARHVVHPPALIVVAEFAPVGARRLLLPSLSNSASRSIRRRAPVCPCLRSRRWCSR